MLANFAADLWVDVACRDRADYYDDLMSLGWVEVDSINLIIWFNWIKLFVVLTGI